MTIFPISVDPTETSQLLSISQMNLKRMKVKPAAIADDDDDTIDDQSENALNISIKGESMMSEKSFEIDGMGNREHLETKKQIEEIRKEYGNDWLNSKGATKVQNVMGIQASPVKPLGKSPQTTEQMLERLFGMNSSTSSNQQRSSTPIQNDIGLGHSPTEVCQTHTEGSFDYYILIVDC